MLVAHCSSDGNSRLCRKRLSLLQKLSTNCFSKYHLWCWPLIQKMLTWDIVGVVHVFKSVDFCKNFVSINWRFFCIGIDPNFAHHDFCTGYLAASGYPMQISTPPPIWDFGPILMIFLGQFLGHCIWNRPDQGSRILSISAFRNSLSFLWDSSQITDTAKGT